MLNDLANKELFKKTQLTFDEKVMNVCNNIAQLLITKNRKYGDAALNPKRIFSKTSNIEQIQVRIDDKLSRIANRQSDEDEDVIMDLIGYLVLYKIALDGKKEEINRS